MEAVLSAQQHPRTRVPDPSDGPADTRPPAKQQPESQGPAGLVRSMLRTRTSRAAVRPNTRLAAWTACRFSPNLSVSHYLVAGVSFSQYLVGLEESGAWVVLPPC